MKDQDKNRKQESEMNKIRRWILKSVSKSTPETPVTLYSIKKFLDSKQNGLSIHPETKLVMKRLTESGHLVKIDGKYFEGKNNPKNKQPPAQNLKKGSESKNFAKSDGKSSPKDKQPPAPKRKSGGELKNLAKSSTTGSAEKSSSQEAGRKESETVESDMEIQ